MKRILLYLVCGWAVLFLTLVWFVDFDAQMQPLIQISDYLMTFHVAGSLVAHHQLHKLYPPAGSLAFAGMPFDVAAHQILSKMPASSVAEFMYMPLAGAVFVPFSFLPLNLSLFAWQLVSLAAVFLSAQFMWSASGSREPDVTDRINRLLSALLVIPVCLTIWIGQVGAVFGMLPLAGGYYLLSRKKFFLAGLIWSFAIFKPQFLVPVGVILFALAARKNFGATLGVAVGVATIAIIGSFAFSPAINLEWLNCLKVSDVVYSDSRSGIATHLATSLPRTLILMSPAALMPAVKLIAYAFSAIIFVSTLFVVWVFQKNRTGAHDQNGKNDSLVMNLACLVGIFVTPLVMPHFFLYDYCLFALSLPLVYSLSLAPSTSFSLKRLLLVTILLINSYSLICLVAHQYAMPILFMGAMLALLVLLLKTVRVASNP